MKLEDLVERSYNDWEEDLCTPCERRILGEGRVTIKYPRSPIVSPMGSSFSPKATELIASVPSGKPQGQIVLVHDEQTDRVRYMHLSPDGHLGAIED